MTHRTISVTPVDERYLQEHKNLSPSAIFRKAMYSVRLGTFELEEGVPQVTLDFLMDELLRTRKALQTNVELNKELHREVSKLQKQLQAVE